MEVKYTWEFASMVKGTERNKEKRARRGLVRFLRKCINVERGRRRVRLPRLPPRQTNVDRLTRRSFYSCHFAKILGSLLDDCRSRVLRVKHLVVMIRLFTSLNRSLSRSLTCYRHLSLGFEHLEKRNKLKI